MLTATESPRPAVSPVAAVPADEFRTRRTGTLRILHISDLHIQANTNFRSDRPWPQLRTVTAEIHPDLIVATGDIADRPFFEHVREQGRNVWSRVSGWFSSDSAERAWDAGLADTLTRSREYLHSLCDAAGLDRTTRLRVIPGNHDYRVQGLLSRGSSAATTFKEVFSGVCEDVQNTWRDPTGPHAAFRTRIYCLDSNGPDELSNFAAGRVDDVELSRVPPSIDDTETGALAESDEFRIVLMHHHPMPIAELEALTRTRLARLRAITEDDRFLMLRNAGTVMQHLTGGRVHLVLHGHRHHRGYAQVAFPQLGSKQEATHRMTIVAAGSIGTSGNQFSVIDVRPPGGIEVEEWSLEATVFRRQTQRTLVEVDTVRAERSRQARARNADIAAAFADSIEDHIEVSSSGDARVRRIYRGLRPLAQASLTQVPIGVGTALGYIHPSQSPEVTVFKEGTGQRADFVVAREDALPAATATGDAPRVTGFVRFSPPIEPGREIDVQVEFLVVNAHETLREFRLARDPGSEGREHAGYNTRRVPCERLIRIIRRPLELDRAGCEWRATVLRPNGEKDWDEWSSSSLTAQAVSGLGAFLMTVRRPLSGHNYRIEWDLPKLNQLEATLQPVHKFEFEQFYAKLSDPTAASAVERALSSTLADLAAELAKHRGVTNFDAQTVMSFMRFDRDRILLSRITDSSGNRSAWDLVPGNGIPGQALRRRRPVLHSTHGGTEEACYYVRPPYLSTDHRFQLSLPVTYLPIRTGSKLYPVLGVVSLESTTGDRELLNLVSGEEHDAALRQALVQWISDRLVRALAQRLGIPIDMTTWT